MIKTMKTTATMMMMMVFMVTVIVIVIGWWLAVEAGKASQEIQEEGRRNHSPRGSLKTSTDIADIDCCSPGPGDLSLTHRGGITAPREQPRRNEAQEAILHKYHTQELTQN